MIWRCTVWLDFKTDGMLISCMIWQFNITQMWQNWNDKKSSLNGCLEEGRNENKLRNYETDFDWMSEHKES
jgi:hypothetical protein